MNWIISAKSKLYDHASAFEKWGYIDWCIYNTKYSVGDLVYIYCTNPVKKVMYKAIVEKVGLTNNMITNDSEFWHDTEAYKKSLNEKHARLRLIGQVDREELSLSLMLVNGLIAAPQGPNKLSEQLKKYIDGYMNDYFYDNIFPDSADTDCCSEGATTMVAVNKYERSSIAREKCISFNGCYCHICGMDFQKTYGEIGKNFIHVHHKIPLNEIQKEYTVNYKNDLVPLCPNCHAMLHRKMNGRTLTIEELKSVFVKHKNV